MKIFSFFARVSDTENCENTRKMALDAGKTRSHAVETVTGAVSTPGFCAPSIKRFFAQKSRVVFRVLGLGLWLFALSFGLATPSFAAPDESPIFPKLRRLNLEECRALSLSRSSSIALSSAKTAQARAALSEQEKRLKITTQGGLDPFSGKIRFYLALDLERLLQLNKDERNRARFALEAEQTAQTAARNAALKTVTSAWFSLRRAESSVTGAARLKETSRALQVAAETRFNAGNGELSGVLSSLKAFADAGDAYDAARQNVSLAALDLAQACGFPTAEEMEAALP